MDKIRRQGQIWPVSLSPSRWKSGLPRMFIFDAALFVRVEKLGCKQIKVCSSKLFMHISLVRWK